MPWWRRSSKRKGLGGVRLQHLPGLSVNEIRAEKQTAASDTDDMMEEAEPLIRALEEQDLGNEEPEAKVFDRVNVLVPPSGRQDHHAAEDSLIAEDSNVLDKVLGLPPKKRTDSTRPIMCSLGG